MTWAAFADDDTTFVSATHSPTEQRKTEQSDQHGAHRPTAMTQKTQDSGLPPSPSLGVRFIADVNPCQSLFAVQDRATGRVFDVPESFSPPGGAVIFYKGVLTVISLFLLVFGWYEAADHVYLALPEHWAVAFSTAYSVLSLGNSILSSRVAQPEQTAYMRIRLTWFLAEVASHFGGLVTILFWWKVFDMNDVDLLALATHGPLALCIWIDAIWVNRIPFRWTHWYCFILPIESLWVIWSVLFHNSTLYDRVDTKGDYILFEWVDWTDDWQAASKNAAIGLLGIGSGVFLFLWLLSIYHIPCCLAGKPTAWKDKRKYIDSFKDFPDPRPTVEDVEEGSIFAKWLR